MIGTVSGSSVANVVVDGVFNIPMMKASGFRSTVAGAIEAMNSTAGQIVPPVMGTAAFIMAEILGISYAKVCIAAIIPSALYYVAAYFMIDFYAAKNGLKGVPRDQLPRFGKLIVGKVISSSRSSCSSSASWSSRCHPFGPLCGQPSSSSF